MKFTLKHALFYVESILKPTHFWHNFLRNFITFKFQVTIALHQKTTFLTFVGNVRILLMYGTLCASCDFQRFQAYLVNKYFVQFWYIIYIREDKIEVATIESFEVVTVG